MVNPIVLKIACPIACQGPFQLSQTIRFAGGASDDWNLQTETALMYFGVKSGFGSAKERQPSKGEFALVMFATRHSWTLRKTTSRRGLDVILCHMLWRGGVDGGAAGVL
jgi:hypothetical protein